MTLSPLTPVMYFQSGHSYPFPTNDGTRRMVLAYTVAVRRVAADVYQGAWTKRLDDGSTVVQHGEHTFKFSDIENFVRGKLWLPGYCPAVTLEDGL